MPLRIAAFVKVQVWIARARKERIAMVFARERAARKIQRAQRHRVGVRREEDSNGQAGRQCRGVAFPHQALLI